MAIAKATRLNKLRVNVSTVRNMTIYLLIVKLQKPLLNVEKYWAIKNFVATVQELNTGPRNAAALKLALNVKTSTIHLYVIN